MEGTVSLQEQYIFSTQDLEKGKVFNYGYTEEKLFEDLPDEFSRFFIAEWKELEPALQVQSKFQRFSRKKEAIGISANRSEEIKIIQRAKQWHWGHLKEILKKYENKYIAIIINPTKGMYTPFEEAIIGSAKDFHQLASKVYRKHGYKTIYMPFITKSPVAREFQIPTPLWIKRK